jgi:CDP-glucose 4,6-dehydratase
MESKIKKSIFNNVYEGKAVLVTGDTGFKGTWLSIWLNLLGARVIGYSAYLPSRPCMFSICGMPRHIEHIKGDIRDHDSLDRVFNKYKPDFVFPAYRAQRLP